MLVLPFSDLGEVSCEKDEKFWRDNSPFPKLFSLADASVVGDPVMKNESNSGPFLRHNKKEQQRYVQRYENKITKTFSLPRSHVFESRCLCRILRYRTSFVSRKATVKRIVKPHWANCSFHKKRVNELAKNVPFSGDPTQSLEKVLFLSKHRLLLPNLSHDLGTVPHSLMCSLKNCFHFSVITDQGVEPMNLNLGLFSLRSENVAFSHELRFFPRGLEVKEGDLSFARRKLRKLWTPQNFWLASLLFKRRKEWNQRLWDFGQCFEIIFNCILRC